MAFLAFSSLAFASAGEDWWNPSTTSDQQGGWGPNPHGHHHPTTTTTTATDWLPTTAWVPTTDWVPTTTWISESTVISAPWSEVSEYTSYSLTTITISFNTCSNGCFESTTFSTFSVPVSTYPVTVPSLNLLGAAPSTTSWSLSLPSTTNGWTLLPPTGATTYGSGSVLTYVSGSSTSLSTLKSVSYTSFTSYSTETFISGSSTSLSTVGIPIATPLVVTGSAERGLQRGWNDSELYLWFKRRSPRDIQGNWVEFNFITFEI
ncbi:hypothetical protein L207DRAFT_593637 [Hyaloscypha variabilis F]|uniref:Uncharacterized protein n=1 Tax=Hyaloscypha variabilis (strain UAMH 11265 / GT02V1 / F) TaxID=1149755 RepID=A0A2J6QSI6_HYAVF|nr:hypothetical protein L207DRAFT_593637 [Hyaloscypha variabilis F]